MKLNPEYILRKIAGECVIVPTGSASQKFNGLINLNETGVFLWNCVAAGDSRAQIMEKVLDEYETDRETAEKDVNGFLDMLLENGFATE